MTHEENIGDTTTTTVTTTTTTGSFPIPSFPSQPPAPPSSLPTELLLPPRKDSNEGGNGDDLDQEGYDYDDVEMDGEDVMNLLPDLNMPVQSQPVENDNTENILLTGSQTQSQPQNNISSSPFVPPTQAFMSTQTQHQLESGSQSGSQSQSQSNSSNQSQNSPNPATTTTITTTTSTPSQEVRVKQHVLQGSAALGLGFGVSPRGKGTSPQDGPVKSVGKPRTSNEGVGFSWGTK
jgi:hypothetical protein